MPLPVKGLSPDSYKYFATLFVYPVFISYLCTLNMKQNNNHRTEEEYYIESKYADPTVNYNVITNKLLVTVGWNF